MPPPRLFLCAPSRLPAFAANPPQVQQMASFLAMTGSLQVHGLPRGARDDSLEVHGFPRFALGMTVRSCRLSKNLKSKIVNPSLCPFALFVASWFKKAFVVQHPANHNFRIFRIENRPTMSKKALPASGTNPKVDFYFAKEGTWQQEIALLRTIVLDSGLTEELKWGCPCYTMDNRNIVLIHVFKEYCALLFFKGALLPDTDGILVQQTKNVQSARQLRFTGRAEVISRKATIRAYLYEAIDVERSGRAVTFIKHTELEYPEEFKEILAKKPRVKAAFEALTPGRQRAYNLFFSSARQSKTRVARIEKSIPAILEGKGLQE
ncbi:MAG: hypothetical protein JWP27_705 [Flaviaesturariibacter sp.]|nr:hypothetical protein [Flaviaesturariibacter sp.]